MTSTLNAMSRGPGQVAGLAPSAGEVRTARRGRILAFAIYGIPLLLLMIGMYVRLFASADRLDLGFFGYVFPLIVVAVLASLLWALVVEPYSRGNSLGDHLQAQQAVDAETVDLDLELLDQGREAVREGRRQADLARTALLSADEELVEMADLGHRGLQIAHAALGVPSVTAIRPENLITPTFLQRDRIARAVEAELARTERDAVDLEQSTLPALEELDSPHLVYAVAPSVEPDLGFVVPTSIASYPESTLSLTEADDDAPTRRGPGWKFVTAGVVLVALAVAGGVLYGKSTATAAATAAEPYVVVAGDVGAGIRGTDRRGRLQLPGKDIGRYARPVVMQHPDHRPHRGQGAVRSRHRGQGRGRCAQGGHRPPASGREAFGQADPRRRKSRSE